MTSHTWSIIINPHAGRKALSRGDVESAVSKRGLDATISVTASLEELRATVNEHARSGVRSYVAVGGDGTAHHIINAIMATGLTDSERFVLAIVATGSGSDFVRTFGHRPGLEPGLDRIVMPDLYPIDIGHLEAGFGSRFFLNAANTGVAAAAALRAEHLPRAMGPRRYTAGFWLELPRFPVRSISLACDRHRFEGEAISVVVANGQFFGGGMNVAPRATLVDGLFDVQVFRAPKRQAFTVMPRIIRGNHLTHTGVRRYTGGSISISDSSDWPVEADGEYLGRGPVSMTILPAAIEFVA
ncbi:MAG: YegS/Rv2252/BmrU family lipid kinase [Actinomycetia bacterium]|nr:YegS/Rv2252/BmrU family lipid kinase [Actinomycetes bacterium]